MQLKLESIVIWGFLLVVIVFLAPSITLLDGESAFSTLIEDRDFFRTTFLRSLVIAFISAICCVLFGMVAGLSLFRISLVSSRGRALTIVFLPFVLGNISAAFLFKTLLFNSEVLLHAYENTNILSMMLIGMQVWQFGTLFAYLFWIKRLSIPENNLIYSRISKMNLWENFVHIILPEIKNLIVLLFLMAFVFTLYEDSKTNLIFKASQGTDSEMISHWLQRNFRKDIMVNFNYAGENVFSLSWFVILPISLLCFSLLAVALSGFLGKLVPRIPLNLSKPSANISKIFGSLIQYLILALIVAPIIATFIIQPISLHGNLNLLGKPLILSAIAAMISSLFAVFLGVSLRLAFSRIMGDLNRKSVLVIACLFLVLLLPPIVIMLSGFSWMGIVGYSSRVTIIAIWTFGHVFLSLPILGSFLIITHFSVKSKELDFLKVNKVSRFETMKLSFFKRFSLEYLLTFLFAISLIWNEGVLNRVFSDQITSFVSSMETVLSSRGADYSVGMLFFVFSLGLGVAVAIVWNLIISKSAQPR